MGLYFSILKETRGVSTITVQTQARDNSLGLHFPEDPCRASEHSCNRDLAGDDGGWGWVWSEGEERRECCWVSGQRERSLSALRPPLPSPRSHWTSMQRPLRQSAWTTRAPSGVGSGGEGRASAAKQCLLTGCCYVAQSSERLAARSLSRLRLWHSLGKKNKQTTTTKVKRRTPAENMNKVDAPCRPSASLKFTIDNILNLKTSGRSSGSCHPAGQHDEPATDLPRDGVHGRPEERLAPQEQQDAASRLQDNGKSF